MFKEHVYTIGSTTVSVSSDKEYIEFQNIDQDIWDTFDFENVTDVVILSGHLPYLNIPEGIKDFSCTHDIGIRSVNIPSSVEEITCRNQNIHHIHIPENVRGIWLSNNNIEYITFEDPTRLYHIYFLGNKAIIDFGLLDPSCCLRQ